MRFPLFRSTILCIVLSAIPFKNGICQAPTAGLAKQLDEKADTLKTQTEASSRETLTAETKRLFDEANEKLDAAQAALREADAAVKAIQELDTLLNGLAAQKEESILVTEFVVAKLAATGARRAGMVMARDAFQARMVAATAAAEAKKQTMRLREIQYQMVGLKPTPPPAQPLPAGTTAPVDPLKELAEKEAAQKKITDAATAAVIPAEATAKKKMQDALAAFEVTEQAEAKTERLALELQDSQSSGKKKAKQESQPKPIDPPKPTDPPKPADEKSKDS